MSDPARLAASGPRAAGHEAQYEQLVRCILDGANLHYGPPAGDPDLALLQGDQLYARGLEMLAELGDLEATTELADVISLVAQAQTAGDDALVEAIWEAGAAAIGWGTNGPLESAKALARSGGEDAPRALREAARATWR
jgi:hypothetical protein